MPSKYFPCAALLAAAWLPGLSGCASLGYYWQSVSGHLQLMNAARPVQDWLGETGTPEKLKARLELAQRIRSFAVSELRLPENAGYRRYADLRRSAAVWNVVAAPALSLTLKTWCFPVAGCVGYRGYFDEQQARAEAARLQAQGLDVHVHGVPAYSTLGWMNWAGGDPLLSTFVGYPEGALASVIFHELAHQVVYAKDDTVFNVLCNGGRTPGCRPLAGGLWLRSRAKRPRRAGGTAPAVSRAGAGHKASTGRDLQVRQDASP